MTDEQLAAIRARHEAATPPPYFHTFHDGKNVDGMAAFLKQGLAYRPECTELELVTTGVPNDDGVLPPDSVMIETTGNGPTSKANAHFIVFARSDIPALLAEVERLRGLLSKRAAV